MAFGTSSQLERGTDELDAGGAAPRTRLIGAAAFALGGLFFLYVGTESAVGGWVAAYANRVESISAMMAALTPAFFWCGLAAGRALAPVALRSLVARKEREKILLGFGVSLAAVASGALLFAADVSNGFIVRDACGPGSRVRVPDIGGLAGSNLWRAGAAIRKHYICDGQPGWCNASVARRRNIDPFGSATGWFGGSDCCVRGDVSGEWIFSWTARGLALAGVQQSLGVNRAFRSFFVLEVCEHVSGGQQFIRLFPRFRCEPWANSFHCGGADRKNLRSRPVA